MYCTTPSGTRYQTGSPCAVRLRQSVEEIASAVVYLLGEESGWVHGQVLRVNGGMV